MKRTSYIQKFVSYLRISTHSQKFYSQRDAIQEFLSKKQKIIAEFKEIGPGKKDDRPELLKAIKMAKRHNATLIVAKLDRLTRNEKLIKKLIKDKVKFICADNPDLNYNNQTALMKMIAFAEFEVSIISQRTKAGLDAKRRREPHWKPGKNNLTDAGRQKAVASMKRNANSSLVNIRAFAFIRTRIANGMSLEEIAKELNIEGYRTRYGKQFFGQTVKNIYKRFSSMKNI